MPAPKGNRFWEVRSSHGRNPKFESADALWDACIEYFHWVEENPLVEAKAFSFQGDITIASLPKMRAMTIGSLCLFLGVCEKTWYNYREREGFLQATTRAEQVMRAQKFAGAAAELLNPQIIARDLGLADKREHTGPDGGPIKTESKVLNFVGVDAGHQDTE